MREHLVHDWSYVNIEETFTYRLFAIAGGH